MDTIKIPRQNDFTLAFPFVERKFVDGKAVYTPLDLAQYTNIQITVESQDGTYKENYNGTIDGNILSVEFQETLPINTYNVIISGKYNGKDKTSLLKRCFAIVQWNQQSNRTDYIAGSPILMPTSVFVTGGSNASGMKTLVINIPVEDLARIISSHKTDGMPDEYLVNADLGFGMNEINAFIEGKLNVQLMTNLKGALSDDDLILTMTLDNVIVNKIPEEENILLNGERVIYGIGLTYINNGAIRCDFALSEHYCTAIVDEVGIPDYSSAIAEAKQMAINAQQTADEALQATQEITDPTNGGQTTINDALSNVYYSSTHVIDPTNGASETPINDALSNVYNSATQVTDPTNGSYPTPISDALSHVYYSSTHVIDPTNGASETPINDALSNLNNKINNVDDDLIVLFVSQIIRDFTADISLIGDGKCISIASVDYGLIKIDDEMMNQMYRVYKTGEQIEGSPLTLYSLENTSRKVTLRFDGKTLPTFKMTNVAYPDYTLDIIINDTKIQEMISSLLGLQDVVSLRMLDEPIVVGTNNDNCYWALVTKDRTVHNPGTY